MFWHRGSAEGGVLAGDASRSSSTTSVSLLRRLRCQDPDAWVRLSRIYGPLVYRWCRRAGVSADEAADVVQEVFQAVAKGIHGFRHGNDGDSFRGWLFGIARFKINDHFRGLARRPDAVGGTAMQQRLAQVPELDEASAASITSGDDQSLVVREALNLIRPEFEDKNWQAFWRTTIDGQRSSDVAAELDMTANAVRQAKYRVLRRLRRELEGLDDA